MFSSLLSTTTLFLAFTAAAQAQSSPSHNCFTLTLDKVAEGSPSITSFTCQFSYTWDNSTMEGEAYLQQVDSALTNVELHPLGIQGQLDFMSDGSSNITVAGGDITLTSVILDVIGGVKSSYVRFLDVDGKEAALATQTWSD